MLETTLLKGSEHLEGRSALFTIISVSFYDFAWRILHSTTMDFERNNTQGKVTITVGNGMVIYSVCLWLTGNNLTTPIQVGSPHNSRQDKRSKKKRMNGYYDPLRGNSPGCIYFCCTARREPDHTHAGMQREMREWWDAQKVTVPLSPAQGHPECSEDAEQHFCAAGLERAKPMPLWMSYCHNHIFISRGFTINHSPFRNWSFDLSLYFICLCHKHEWHILIYMEPNVP